MNRTNRNLAAALIAVTAAISGTAFAAPDAYEPAVAVSGPSRARTEVAAEAVQAAKVNGYIVGADTLVKSQPERTTTRARADVQAEAVQTAHNTSGFLLTPQ